MKKLLILLCLLPLCAQAQLLEAGADFGNVTNGSLAIRFCKSYKAGIGYEIGNFSGVSVLGGRTITLKMNVPYLFVERYDHIRRHEFYYGIDAGKLYLRNTLDFEGYQNETGFELGAHAGYSLRIIGALYANGQVGLQYYRATIDTHYASNKAEGYVMPLAIGVHLLLF